MYITLNILKVGFENPWCSGWRLYIFTKINLNVFLASQYYKAEKVKFGIICHLGMMSSNYWQTTPKHEVYTASTLKLDASSLSGHTKSNFLRLGEAN